MPQHADPRPQSPEATCVSTPPDASFDSHPTTPPSTAVVMPLNLKLQAISVLGEQYASPREPHSSDRFAAARALAARKSALLSLSPACNFEALSLHFHLPLKAAAEKFGVRATAFKKRCRAIGIRHWPYRKVRSLKRNLQELHRCKDDGPLSDKQQKQYAAFKSQLDTLMAPETYGLDASGRLTGRPQQPFDDDDVDDSDDGTASLASTSSPRFSGDAPFLDWPGSASDASTTDAGAYSDFLPTAPVHLRSIRRSQPTYLPSASFGRALTSLGTSPSPDVAAMMARPDSKDSLCSNEALDAYYAKLRVPFSAYTSLSQFEIQAGGYGNPAVTERAAALLLQASPSSQRQRSPAQTIYTSHNGEADSNQLRGDFPPSASSAGNAHFEDERTLRDADGEFTAHANHVDYTSERFFDDVFLQISPDYGCLV